MGSLGEGRDPERPGRDQALTTVGADGPANGQIAQRAPLRGDRHSRPARQIILKDLRQIIFKMTVSGDRGSQLTGPVGVVFASCSTASVIRRQIAAPS
jgi:hypothetical protein